MKEWTYRFALPLILVALLPALIGLRLYSAQAAELDRSQIRNCEQIEHLKDLSRSEKQDQLLESRRYLREHPNGTRDIPLDLIERGIARTERQIASLAPITCQ